MFGVKRALRRGCAYLIHPGAVFEYGSICFFKILEFFKYCFFFSHIQFLNICFFKTFEYLHEVLTKVIRTMTNTKHRFEGFVSYAFKHTTRETVLFMQLEPVTGEPRSWNNRLRIFTKYRISACLYFCKSKVCKTIS